MSPHTLDVGSFYDEASIHREPSFVPFDELERFGRFVADKPESDAQVGEKQRTMTDWIVRKHAGQITHEQYEKLREIFHHDSDLDLIARLHAA